MVDLCLRQILMDRLTLRDYAAGDSVSWMDIRRRLMLNEREVDPTECGIFTAPEVCPI